MGWDGLGIFGVKWFLREDDHNFCWHVVDGRWLHVCWDGAVGRMVFGYHDSWRDLAKEVRVRTVGQT